VTVAGQLEHVIRVLDYPLRIGVQPSVDQLQRILRALQDLNRVGIVEELLDPAIELLEYQLKIGTPPDLPQLERLLQELITAEHYLIAADDDWGDE
jgi:hypothetical protein